MEDRALELMDETDDPKEMDNINARMKNSQKYKRLCKEIKDAIKDVE